jgi:predicted helicase
MSVQLVQQYYAKVEKLIQYSGTRNESTLRKAFQDLLEQYAHSKNLLLVPEVEYITKKGYKVYPDGTLKDALRQDWGYWESKDEKDNLAQEIASKFAKGYPNFNILFEDTHTAILFQNGGEISRADFADAQSLDSLLIRFVSYESPQVREFHKAIEQFSADVPKLAETLRKIIEEQTETNNLFREKSKVLLEHFKKAINPNIQIADIREMIIQHILTEDIFMRIFDDAEFHRENNIAVNLSEISNTFYTGTTKRNIDNRISYYYETINAKASQISDHHEKQKFLKALYENFYRAYNPKAADRLGVIYTPEEIVNFMIESTDYLLFKHFNKSLGEKDVEILDPATGTGTFITEIIEYLPLNQLESKYENEIHCNEVAILPYYIANLNIEYTYKQKTGKYKEFENICLVDTLDNLGFLKNFDSQIDMFWLSDENAERIDKQNTKKISVIIGNPPYNANQLNENENNKNREYPSIDKRIKETYIKQSTAQKTKLYDMYARFLRWSSDRISENGMIAFVSNNSFIDARSFDGFRKVVTDEFSDIYIINLKGDARTSGERRKKEGGNIFSDQIRVGVAVYFLIKKKTNSGCQIHYNEIDDYLPAEAKKGYLRERKLKDLPFIPIHPDARNNWLNKSINNWDDLVPVASKEYKLGNVKTKRQPIFKLFSLGVATNRDEWVFDFNRDLLEKKIRYFIEQYNKSVSEYFNNKKLKELNSNILGVEIKWTRAVKNDLQKGRIYKFDENHLITSLYRPFVKYISYFDKDLNEMQYQLPKIFAGENSVITFSGGSSSKPFSVLATNHIYSLDLLEKTQCLPYYIFVDSGERVENIVDDAQQKFQKYYMDETITKRSIFIYVYAVLHNPIYREKYKMNLKNEFPHIPFYKDFWKWSEWGKTLMDLHINFEQVPTYPLQREEIDPETSRKAIVPKLLTRKESGKIEIDTLTTLTGIPAEVWDYHLGTYSAVEWVLERYKEKTPRDPTIREKFYTYKFADYKEQVIDLIGKVCTVSVETMKIVKEMDLTGEA